MLYLKTIFVLLLSCCVADARTNKIALDKIWALEMPGTKNVRDLQEVPKGLPKKELLSRSYVRQIEVALSRRNAPSNGELPRPALVVKGTGLEALKEAARILSEVAEKGNKKEPELIQPADTELSLVFYSYQCGHYVQITDVERNQKTVAVKYRFVSHYTTNVTSHFALIPLGKLPKGARPVKIIQEPRLDEKGNEADRLKDARRIVCESFTFSTE